MPEPQLLPSAPPEGYTAPAYKLDVPLHAVLMGSQPGQRSLPPIPPPGAPLQSLPEPVFPQRPELLGEDNPRDPDWSLPAHQRRHWTPHQIVHTLQGWLVPYMKSRVKPGDFHPLIAYLFTEWKCNLDCNYCWAFDNRVKGMNEDVARRSIDWLFDHDCRVLALMGGEPLLRPDFAHKVIYYAAKRGMWVYLPTNGRLMREDVIDKLADAGLATLNLAVDAVDIKPGLPKALAPIRNYFDYLVKRQYRYGYSVFFNVNICRNNLDDVRQLTEIARDNGIATDYHVCETPLTEQSHFRHLNDNPTYIRPEDWPLVDEVLDWLIEKQKGGYRMLNSTSRLAQMKTFMRSGMNEPWNCRAGQNSLIIRTDGSLAPCFPMYSATYDWGHIEKQKFETAQLNQMKESCQQHCFSTLNHILGYCYDDGRVIRTFFRQALRGFQGIEGNLE